MKQIKWLLGISAALFLFGCSSKEYSPGSTSKKTEAKNVILVVGDGMGPQQVGLLLTYAQQSPNAVIRTTAFDKLMEKGVLGIATTHTHQSLVADSAASASQLASGVPSRPESIGLNIEGNKAITVLEAAIKAGKSTGLISDTRITHATPASFAAHQSHRSLENEIAVDLLNSGVDVMFSGGMRYWIPKGATDKNSATYKKLVKLTQGSVKIKTKRKDSRNLLEEAQAKGYGLAFNKSQLNSASGKTIGLFSHSALPGGIRASNSKNDPDRTIPNLTEMTAKALEILSKNEKGFFLMVEAGQIDWAGHYNDTGTMLHEMMQINDTLNYILKWAKNLDDTLVIITADHETGGFGFSYSANNLPKAKKLSGDAFKDKVFQPKFNFGSPEVLDKLYNQKLSYADIFYSKFDSLDKKDRTPENLKKIVNQYTEFPITTAQAARILETEDNPYYVKGHPYLGSKRVPKIDVNDAFFVYQTDDNRQNLLAIEVATSQFAVWSTGTHTATPVYVFALGAGQQRFGTIGNLSHIGQLTMDAVLGR